MTTLFFLGMLLVADILLYAIVLSWLAACFRAENPTVGRGVLATLCISLPSLVFVAAMVYFLRVLDSVSALLLSLGLVGISIAINAAIISVAFKLRFTRSVVICLLQLLVMNVLGFGEAFLIRNALLNTFLANGISMAPTIVGEHRSGVCPDCGGTLIVRAIAANNRGFVDEAWQNEAICCDCRKCRVADKPSEEPKQPDRIISSVFLEPERWDLVTYEPPGGIGGGQIWVGRVVGLPGEKVWINDGELFIDGKKLSFPDSMKGTLYQSEMPSASTPLRFISEESARPLRKDQFCILGDFSANALDSRFYGSVSRKNITGVVSVCYWPPERWRIWR
jgi:signal peptidase I